MISGMFVLDVMNYTRRLVNRDVTVDVRKFQYDEDLLPSNMKDAHLDWINMLSNCNHLEVIPDENNRLYNFRPGGKIECTISNLEYKKHISHMKSMIIHS